MNHPLLGTEAFVALQATRDVHRMRSVQLGLSTILIGLTPATMDKVTLSVDFILDTDDRLRALVKLIDSAAFTSALSLAPGAAAVASTISSLSKGLWCKVEICKPRRILKVFRLRRRALHSRSPAPSSLRLRAFEARTALAECDVKAQRRQA